MFRMFWRKGGAPRYSEELGHTLKELRPMNGHVAPNTVFISLPQNDILPLVTKYIGAMETEESDKWCRCEWITHPDDQEITTGNCRQCNMSKKAHEHTMSARESESFDMPDVHKFKGIRKRRGDEDATCPVHTREGMVIYFFEWVFTNAARQ